MYKIILLFIVLFNICFAKPIKIVYNDGTPPLKFTDTNGKPTGMLLDIWKLWADKNDYKIEFVKTSWDDSLEMIKDGRADIHAGLYYTKEREKFLDYSKKPLYENKNYFFYEKETINQIESINDLKPFIVGVGNGYPVKFMEENYPEIITKHYSSNNDTITAIKNGEVKVFLNSLATFKYALKINKIDVNSFKYLEDKPAFVKQYYGAVKKGNKKILSLINNGFKKITDEEIKNIETKWTDNFEDIQIEQNQISFLSNEEKNWIEKNKEISVIKFFNEPPFTINKEKKEGYIYELIEYLAKSVGLGVKYVDGFTSYNSMIDGVKDSKVDILSSLPSDFKTNDSEIKKSKTILSTPFVIIGKISQVKINKIDDLFGKKVAVVKGYAQDKYLSSFKKIKKVYINNNDEGYEYVRSGKADFFINNRANSEYILNKSFTTDLNIAFEFPYSSFPPLEMSFAITGKKQTLVSILEKALEQMPANEIKKIKNKWLIPAFEKSIVFTKEEKEFLEKHPTIVLGADQNWQPFDFRDKYGKHAGFDAEYINLLRKKLNIDIKIELGAWGELQNKVKDKNLDGLVGPSKTDSRDEYMVFTEPYFFLTQVVIIRKDNQDIKNINNLNGKAVGFKSGSSDLEYMKKTYPNIIQKIYNTHGDIIRAVSIGEIDAGFTNIGAASFEMEKNFISNLKVAFDLNMFTSDMRFGIRKDWPLLTSILQKGIDSISSEEINDILLKWLKLALNTKSENKINLSEKEKEFIEKHPVIKVHNEKNWPPFNFHEFDQPRGYSIDLMNLVAENTGLNIEYVTGPTWDQFLQMIKKDELDVMLNIVQSDERLKYLTFTDPFISALHGIVIHKDSKDINSFQDLIDNNKTIALERGFFYHEYFKTNFPNTKLNLVDNGAQTLTEVSYKRADATLGILPVMNYLAEKNFITNLKFFGDSYEKLFEPIDLRFATRKNLPELKSILQKGLASITPEQKKELSRRWLAEQENKSKINLTNEEKIWLSNHKTIKFTADPNYLPYEEFDKDGQYNGMVADYLKIIEETLDIKFEKIPTENWSVSLEKAKNKDIDVLSNYTIDNSLKDIHISSKPYISSPISIITKINVKDSDTLEQLVNKKIAVIKGYGYLENIFRKYPNLNYIEVDNADIGLKGVSNGDFDALLCSMTLAHYKINDLGLYNLQISGQTSETMELGLGIRKDWQIFVTIVNKVIDSISHGTKQEIIKKWIGDNFELAQKITLTKQEQNWIDKNEPIKYVYDIDWAPFEWKNELSEHTGIIFDILSIIEQRSGIKFEELTTNSWPEAVDIMQNQKADMYSAIGENEDRKKYLNFTKNSIFETPYVFVARDNDKRDYLETFKVIKNKKVAVVDGYTIHGILKEFKPNLPLTTVKTVQEGFKKVQSGKVDIFIVNAATAKYYINRLGFNDLRIATKTEFNLELKIALQKDLPSEVLSIVDKAIKSISEKEKSDIYFKWTEVLVQSKIDWDLIYKIVGGALLFIFLVSFWNRRLKNAVDEKTHELQNILKSFDKNVIASKTDKKGIITYASEAFCNISGYTQEELIGNTHSIVRHADTPKEIFKDMWKTITKEKVWNGTIKNRKKDGSFYWVKVIISPEYDLKGNFTGYSAIREDVTAKKEVEELSKNLEHKVEIRTLELKEQQQRFELTIAGSGDGLWEYDLDKNENWYSPLFKQMLGYEDDEFPNTMESWQKSVHPDDLNLALNSFKEHIKSDKIFDVNYRIKRKDGKYIWIRSRAKSLRDENNRVTRTSGSIADITELKNIEQEISQNRLFLDSLLDSQEQIVITTDGIELKSANKKFLDFFDLKNIEEFKKDYACICDRFVKDESGDYLQKYMNNISWIEYVLAHNEKTHKAILIKDGIHRVFSVTAAVMPIEDGKIKSAVFTDITELELQKKQIDSILSSVLLPMLITSKKTRKIVYANTFAEEQYDTTMDQLIGLDIDVFYTHESQKDEILKEMLKNGVVQNFETRFKTISGKEFDALLSLVDITFGGEDCFLGVASDISEQKDREKLVQKLHKHTTESIEYASLIQHALIPSNDLFRKYFSDYLTIWHPKDIVGGDIYLFEELRNSDECLLMVIDCTGHGVPGAFVTMLVKAIERQIISDINNSNEDVSPAKILSYFNKNMKHLLKQESEDSISNAGFDGGVLYYNKKESIVKFSGAETPLFYIEEGEVKTIKGNRHSVGYKKCDASYQYKEHTIEVKEGMQFYITTDGYLDQNGGDKGFPFGKKRFSKILEENYSLALADQQEILLYDMQDYQGSEDRNDDITIVGIKIDKSDEDKKIKYTNWDI